MRGVFERAVMVLGVLFAAGTVSGQSDSAFVEAGVNIYRLIGLDRSLGGDELNPYLLQVEVSSGKIGGRIAAGFHRSSETELPSSFNGNTEFDNDTSSVDIRAGLVFHQVLGSKWSLKYGVDGFYSARSRTFNSVVEDVNGLLINSENAREETRIGAGLFLFPQFHLSPRVSIATELNLLFGSSSYSATVTNDEFPDFNTEVKKEGAFRALRAPSALFLVLRF